MPKHGNFALAGVLVAAVMLFDQPSAIQALQSADGTLYLAQGSDALTVRPSPIPDTDLAALTPTGELDGAAVGDGDGAALNVVGTIGDHL
jgi:hypothetical protein